MVVEVVQPNLAPRYHLGMPGETLHVLVSGFIREPGFVGMNTERRIYELVFLRQLNSAIDLRGTVAISDGHHGLNASLARPIDDLFAIGVKSLAIEMCVRIYEH